MSGYTDDALDRHGPLEAGDLFLAKPFTFDQLARQVEALVSSEAPEPAAASEGLG